MMKEYRTIEEISGSLMLVRQVAGVKCGELGEIELPTGEIRLGEVLEVSESNAIVQLFGSGEGISPASGKIKFSGRSLELGVSPDMLGRIFSGMGEPIDRIPKILPKRTLNINGSPINPAARKSPSEFIQTGISAIDGLNPLIRGQKLSVFSGYGLPHAELAAQIARQAKVLSSDAGFAVVFGAIGVTFEEADFFISDFRNSGVTDRTVMFINLASDPVTERNATPRMALTAAEYLAFEENMHVLVILTDIANYSEGLENLASVFERAGEKTGREGSVTIIPILSVPDYGDAVRHITEGQIVLSRDFYRKGCLPPVDILHSLSHLKDKGIGSGKTREDHADMSNQLLVCYSRGCEVRNLKSALTKNEILYAKFADSFEEKYINQSFSEERTIEQTLGLGWELLSALPKSEMKRIRPDIIEKYWRR